MSESEQGRRSPRQQRRAAERKQRKGAGKAVSGAALPLAALAALAAGQPAEAATFTVSNLNDSGPGSLRQAIEDANAAAGADIVAFQAGLTGTIPLTTGQLAITDSVDIQGPGAAVISVSGSNASRVFYLYNGSALLDVTISGLTVTGGNDVAGAGIINFDENLLLDRVTITGNTASVDGGGLWADGFNMNLTIRDSIISGNTAGDDGGGIYVEDTGGPLLIQNSVISGNDAVDSGGGIYFYDPDTAVTIQDSTISDNSAGGLGGGIYLYHLDDGSFTITGTTISGNSAAAGGGIYFYEPGQPVTIENSTISGNQATAGSGGGIALYSFYGGDFIIRHTTVAGNSATGAGGGLFTYLGTVNLQNSIVGDNTAGVNPDLDSGAGGSFDLSYTLVETPGTASINDNGGNLFNQDPQLGPLQDNGGPTETHLPADTSPAVNAGDPAFVPPPTTDQRGSARVADGRLDMGAVELEVNPGTIQLLVTAASINENGGTITITATRTGGSDGAVSVSYTTSDGTAVAPGDYTAAAGTLNWADGDMAPKTFQVTIINDTADEPDETFNVTLSNPQGGATLGANTAEVVTILDDDVPSNVVEIPTMGDYGRMLLVGLCALSGFMMLRRRKGLAAPMLAVSLALGAAGAADAAGAAPGKDAKSQAATLARIEDRGKTIVVHLADGTTIETARDAFKLVDGRKGRRAAAGFEGLPASQPVVLKVRQGKNGEVKKVRVQLVDTPAQAQTLAGQE